MDPRREGAPKQRFEELQSKVFVLLNRFSDERKKFTDTELSELKKKSASLAEDENTEIPYGLIIAPATDDERGSFYHKKEGVYKNLFDQLNVDDTHHVGIRLNQPIVMAISKYGIKMES